MSHGLGNRIAAAVGAARQQGTPPAVAEAIGAIGADELEELFHPRLDPTVVADPLSEGLPASPGAASGRIVLSADEAVSAGDAGADVILVRPETSPDDVLGMQSSRGILTTRGGLASHAAVVARGWGIPAVVGAAEVRIDGDLVTVGADTFRAGDEITIDGSTGRIYAGRLATTGTEPPPELDTLLGWADAVARGRVEVRVNADNDVDARHGRELGAVGIGLCRTEHMFLAADRLPVMRRFILAEGPEAERSALAELEEAQEHDFERLLEAMDGLPVTVRLLDPPLHEFLPDPVDLEVREGQGRLTETERGVLTAVRRLHETNPMIGTRGVRVGVVRSGLYQMQVRALCRAAAALKDRGLEPHVEIMIPLVVDAEELRLARSWVTDALGEIGHPELTEGVVIIGAMVETPRAALTAGALAAHADFFSFGTNDLTQMTYAFSRDDVEAKLLPAYQAAGILPANPFAVLDRDGVGALVDQACRSAREAAPTIKLGVCGEHAGHPASADFLVGLGVDSVSCSPLRVPMARLAVAQALLSSGRVAIDDVDLDLAAGSDAGAATGADGGATADGAADGGDAPLPVDEELVLHVLRIRGFVTPDGFTESIGSHPAELLVELVEGGLVRHMAARDMFGLLPPGRERHDELLAGYADDGVRTGLAGPYERFLELNDAFKELCTAWQVRDGDPNDHSDPDYDHSCTERLAALYRDARPTIGAMASAVPRLARYEGRLGRAIDQVVAGDTSKFTGVMCESFHDIWMEMHEDLIVLQGIDRAQEGSY